MKKLEQHNQGAKYKFLLKLDRKRSVIKSCIAQADGNDIITANAVNLISF